jgi:hypothetical protein
MAIAAALLTTAKSEGPLPRRPHWCRRHKSHCYSPHQAIVAPDTDQIIVAVATNQPIVAVATPQGIVTRQAIDPIMVAIATMIFMISGVPG